MELHQLRYVVAVAKAGSFTRAAEQLLLAQPSLSVQIGKLEKELGTALFRRLGRGVEPTAAGEVFLAHAAAALAHLEEARREVGHVRKLSRGRVVVGALPSVGAVLLPNVLADYHGAHPDIEVRLSEHNVAIELERMVHNGELDLAVVRSPWSRAGVTGQMLIREPMVAMLPPAHRFTGRSVLDLAAIAGDDFVAMQAGTGLRELMETACLRRGFRPRITVETGQLSVLRGMVQKGLGVAVVPRLAASGYPTTIRLDDPDAVRELGVVWRDDSVLAPAPKAFLELVLAAGRLW
ncbi:LysR family transcriptional regulator [Nocardia brasiliensis]|uniref:LysR family transcriptional regulator n=1 Tax=Nocardia brasiliensis TaxID=37326 RepID=UPI003D8DF5A8